jgi:hypothetical protein
LNKNREFKNTDILQHYALLLQLRQHLRVRKKLQV